MSKEIVYVNDFTMHTDNEKRWRAKLEQELQAAKARSYRNFLTGLKTQITHNEYCYWLKRYAQTREINSPDDYDFLVQDTPDTIQKRLEDYLFDIRADYSLSTIKAIFKSIEHFYVMNDVIINFKKIRKMYPTEEYPVGGKAYSTEEVGVILDQIGKGKRIRVYNNLRLTAIIHFLACTGVRVGALTFLKMEDLQEIEDCYSAIIYSETSDEYLTFLTPEAKVALDDYIMERINRLKLKNPEYKDIHDLRLDGKSKVFDIDYFAITKAIERLQHNIERGEKGINGRFAIPINHGFRKRVNTLMKSVKEVNVTNVEYIMGHLIFKRDAEYFRPKRENLFEDYKKCISLLTVKPRQV